MLTQNQIKHIRSLQQKKFRDEYKQFLAEGPKLVEELIGSKFSFDCIYAKKEWLADNAARLQAKEIQFIEINSKELERISGLIAPNVVLAVINTPEKSFPENIFGKELILVLDQIKDPGNMGTIIRTADWFGINHIFCSENTVDVFNPKVVQSSMGSISRVNVYYTGIEKLLTGIHTKVSIYGAYMNGENIHDIPVQPNGVIVIGNESSGISTELKQYIHHKVSIPYFRGPNERGAESLNASIASAIMCYEFRKKTAHVS